MLYTSNNAFSLLELLIVMALFMFIVALTIPGLYLFKRQAMSTELDTLCMVIRLVQQSALTQMKPVELGFDATANSYTYNGTTRYLPAGICFGIKPGVQGPPSAPYKFLENPITFKDNRLIGNHEGIITAGTVYLTDTHRTCLYAITVHVGDVSYIRRYHFDGSWKELV